MKEPVCPKVVAIGGGTGLSTMLRGLKYRNWHLTAVVTVGDDGGSSGRLRTDLNMLPPGDIRNVLVALADTEPLLEKMLQYRFKQGEGLIGHSLGNLLLAALNDVTGDFVKGIKELSRVLAVRGKVLPASDQAVVLKATMTDGTEVVGESQIPLAGKRIQRLELIPGDVAANEEAVKEIMDADCLIVGPGSLYTSLLPNLLVKGLVEAVRRSSALKIFVCNLMTQPGETDGLNAVDHLKVFDEHVGNNLFDLVIVNCAELPPSIARQYAEKGSYPVEPAVEALAAMGYQVIADNLISYETYLRHNANRLGDLIEQALKQWLENRRN
jgi:uncharacterized cofD-like protein